MFNRKKQGEKKDAELYHIPNIPPPPPELESEPKPQMVARVWRAQPPVKLALHESVVALLRGIEAENAALEAQKAAIQSRIDDNNYVTVKTFAALLKHYNHAIDPTKAPYFETADSDILVIPQPRVQEETTEDVAN